MKPSNLGIPSRDLLAADPVTLERKRIRQRAADEEYFRREIRPGASTYEGTVTESMNTGVVMRFPAAGAGTNAHASIVTEGRELWARTRPCLKLWFTSPGGSTNTFNVRFVVRVFPQDALASSGLVFSTDFSPAGPAVANTVQCVSLVGGAILPAIMPVPVQLRVGRMGGDANANALDILLAVVTFEESA